MYPAIKRVCVLIFLMAMHTMGWAQLSIDAVGVAYTIDFDSTIAGVNNGSFTGSGFHPEPSPGQLNSNAWIVVGLTDGDLAFGDSGTTGDFARGTSAGNVGFGGIYGFNMGGGNRALGFQPSLADLTPGYFALRVLNNTGHIIDSVTIGYDIYVRNDQNKANSLNVAYSYNDTILYTLPGLNFTSPEALDSAATWTPTGRSATIKNLYVPDGEYFFIRWETDTASGSGSMDELALDNITLTFRGDLEAAFITEIHYYPQMDDSGTMYGYQPPAEWFEVYNPNDVAINMRDILIQDNSIHSHSILGDVFLPPTSYFVFAGSCDTTKNGNYTSCGYEYGNTVPWNDGGDIVKLRYPGGGIIDQVNYIGWSILTPGKSLTYIGTEFDDNNDETLWVSASQREFSFSTGVGTSDFGSPGAAGNSQLLAINDVQFEAKAVADGVRLTWYSPETRAIRDVQLYHSLDGKDFHLAQSELTPKGSYLHGDPAIGNNYYQLAWREGETRYRSVIRSIAWRGVVSFDLYPNPAEDKVFITLRAGKLGKIQILNAQGMTLKTIILDDSHGTPVSVSIADLKSGWYLLRYVSDSGNSASKSFLKQ